MNLFRPRLARSCPGEPPRLVRFSRARWNGFPILLLFLSLGGLLLPEGCAETRERTPASSSPRGLEDCLSPDALLSSGSRDKQRCISLLERFLKSAGRDPSADRVTLQLSRFYMERRDFSAAYQLLLPFEDNYPNSRERRVARLYVGICLYNVGRPTESLEILHALVEDPRAGSLTAEAGRYIAENYLKLGQPLSALTWYEKCDGLLRDERAREILRKRVLTVVSEGGDGEKMRLAVGLFPEGFFHEAALLGVAAGAVRKGDLRLAETRMEELAYRHPDDLFTPFVDALEERLSHQDLPSVCTIGCLLPLTGRYAEYGNHILQSLILAAGAFQNSRERPGSVRLLVRDTGGDPATAVKQLQELAGNTEVVGVVGPLLTPVAQACAPVAQKAGLPIICLSQREEAARVGDFVFLNGLTIRQQVENLVEYASNDLGVSRFAILYPEDEYGFVARDAYRDHVAKIGGEVVSAVSYRKEETDFQEEIRALLGEAYWNDMKRREGKGDKKRGNARTSSLPETPGDSLPPRPALPFEALFVPDHYNKAALIAPYLAFYDLDDVVLLGNNAWNSGRLLKEAGDYVRDAVFVDGFFAESDRPHVRQFVESFERDFDRKPGVLEAEGYDSLILLENAFRQANPKTRAGVRDALSRNSDYPGLSGDTSFDEQGCARKHLYLLTVQDHRIQQVPGK
jgi:branched-chain amino acid transport system substrate-binding protein